MVLSLTDVKREGERGREGEGIRRRVGERKRGREREKLILALV